MFPNAKGSELFSVLATIDPASQAVGTATTGWISAGNHHNLLALIQSGALGTNATLDAKLLTGGASAPVSRPRTPCMGSFGVGAGRCSRPRQSIGRGGWGRA